MAINQFVKLWKHRYIKYLHILKAYLLGYVAAIKFFSLKRFKLRDRTLIAIIRTEHFGDIVAAEPISRLVKAQYPNSYIVWFVKDRFKELVVSNPQIDAVYSEFCVTERSVIINSKVFDKVFELQFRNNNECAKCQVFRENPIAVERNIHVGNYFEYGNLLEVFAQCGGLLQRGEQFPVNGEPQLLIQPSHFEKIAALNLPLDFIVIHCQSNYAPKDWPAEKWEKYVTWLLNTYDYPILEIGLGSNLKINSDRFHNLTGKLSLMETAALISKSKLFIGLDSGPSHMANAAGIPSIILMGALNNFLTYNPYSGKFLKEDFAVLVRQNGLACRELPVDFVIQKTRKFMDYHLLIS